MISNDDLILEDAEEAFNSGQEQEETTEHNVNNSGSENEDNEKKLVKPKRIIKNPRPKLNEETLKGPKGLLALESHFERVKFKGKGHEEEDLNVILKTYEYWCHRLFPKLPFDDCIKKIEQLGHKKPVKTFLTKIRMGMLVDDEQAITNNDDEDLLMSPVSQPLPTHPLRIPQPAEDPIEITPEMEERIRRNRERAEQIRKERLLRKQLQDNNSQQMDVTSSQSASQSNINVLTPEIEERIRKNRERAEQLRKQRMQQKENTIEQLNNVPEEVNSLNILSDAPSSQDLFPDNTQESAVNESENIEIINPSQPSKPTENDEE